MESGSTSKSGSAQAGFFAELRRRRVLPIAGAYIAIAWLVVEIVSFLLEQSGAPGWSTRLLAIVFIVGFPIAVTLAWVIQVQPDGRRRFDPSTGQQRTVIWAVVLGIVTTIGLSWLILPRIEYAPDYDPIPNSIAVLPLAAADATPFQQTTAESLYTALLSGLDQSKELMQVRLRVEDVPHDPALFAKDFRVAAVLVGRIVRTTGTAYVEMRLLDVSDGETRWSESFEWEPSRIMQTGTDIANGALAAMSLPQVSRHDFSGTDNREAYDAFLLGKQRSAVVEELELAIADFQRAIELDRGYVRAYIALADTINWYLFNKGPAEKSRETWQERSRQALDTALKLDSESAAAISTLGRLSQDQDTALQLYRRSLALDPGYALSYYRLGRALRRSPDLVEAERLLRTAVDLDPLNASYRFGLGELLRAKGEEEKGLAEFEKSLELDPGLFQPYVDLGSVAHYRDGRIDDAIYFMRMAYSVNPQSGQLAAFVAGAYADLGMREEALAWKDQALQLSPTAHWVWSMAGMVHFRLGDSELGDEYDMRAVELLASDTLLTAQDYDFLSATVFAQNDIRNGHSESGLDRFRTAFPDASRKDVTVDFTNLKLVNEFATLLDMAGHHAEARHRWQRCVEFLRDFYVENTNTNKCPDCWQTYARLQLREETLAGMRRNIVDLNRRNDAWKLEEPFLDWLRGDPAFEELTGILTADLAQQRQRIRELECSGEMPAAPGIDFTPDCN